MDARYPSNVLVEPCGLRSTPPLPQLRAELLAVEHPLPLPHLASSATSSRSCSDDGVRNNADLTARAMPLDRCFGLELDDAAPSLRDRVCGRNSAHVPVRTRVCAVACSTAARTWAARCLDGDTTVLAGPLFLRREVGDPVHALAGSVSVVGDGGYVTRRPRVRRLPAWSALDTAQSLRCWGWNIGATNRRVLV